MHDALLVRRFECYGDLARDLERLLDRDPAALQPLGERLAFHQLEHE